MNYSVPLLTSCYSIRIRLIIALFSLFIFFLNPFLGFGKNPFVTEISKDWNNIEEPGFGHAMLGTPITDIWINEFHYDNDGGDTGEFVEVAGPAGTKLDQCAIIHYNGSDGGITFTINLSGTIPDEGNGYGALSFSHFGFQNSTEGIALVNNVSEVLEFISYEGVFTATEGAANGMLSSDVGVSETGSTLIGYSIQKTGIVCDPDNFSWTDPSQSSPGLLNTNQGFPDLPSVSLSQTDLSIEENGGTDTIIAHLSHIACDDVTINLEVNAASTASGTDFGISSLTIGIQTGDTIGMVALYSIDDIDEEGDEEVVIDIASVVNGAEDGAQQIACTILDDDVFIPEPEILISGPSKEITNTDSVTYIVSYTNVSSVTLDSTDIIINSSGTAVGEYHINVLSDTSRSIVISNITGDGTLGISVAAGSAQNSNGDLCPEAGPSETFIVDNTAPDIDCLDMEVHLNSNGNASIRVDDLDNGTSDLNGLANLYVSKTDFQCSDISNNSGISEIWINEFHYDNVSGDVGEFVELAGTAGIDLSDYEILLYNGGDSEEYGSITLSGVLPDEGNGFGALSFEKVLQNGPDAIALVKGGKVIEFISYEGTITATDGIASGQTSVDIGVAEDGSTPVGFSLQKEGNGSSARDFIWKSPSAASLGQINDGQSISAKVGMPVYLIAEDVAGNIDSCLAFVNVLDVTAPEIECKNINAYLNAEGKVTIEPESLVSHASDACGHASVSIGDTLFECDQITPIEALWINEFHYDNASDDVNEFVEIAGTAGLSLDGFYIFLYNGSNGEFYDSIQVSGTLPNESNGYGALAFPIADIQNGPDGIALVDKNKYIVDFISYEDELLATNGPALGLYADKILCVESSSTQIGYSLQKTGNGSRSNQFNWDGPLEDSPGLLNANQQIEITDFISITAYAEDIYGNVDSCSSEVVIKDSVAPTPVCLDIIVYLDENGEAGIYPSMVDGGSFDNCEINKSWLDITKITCNNLGEITVNMATEDISGNTAFCSSDVEVYDTLAPQLHCHNIKVNLWESGELVLGKENLAEMIEGTADNCSSLENLNFSYSNISFDCSYLNNPDTVRIEVMDESGNIAVCFSRVELDDDYKPVVKCSDFTVNLDSSGIALVYSSDLILEEESFDNCEIVSIELDTNRFSCNDLGENSVKVSVYDAVGNKDWCRSKVWVVDNIPPVFQNVEDVIEVLEPGNCSKILDNYPNIFAPDACEVVYSQLNGLGTGSEFPLGATLETWIAEDIAGNKDTLNFTVTLISPNDPPSIELDHEIVVAEDSTLVTVPISGIGTGSDCKAQRIVSLTASTDNSDLVKSVKIDYSFGNPEGNIILHIAPDKSGIANISVRVKDDGGTDNGGTDTSVEQLKVTVTPVNDPPVCLKQLADQVSCAFDLIQIEIPNTIGEMFYDVDDENISLNVSLEDGSALPDWGNFENNKLTFNPGMTDTGVYSLKVIATDSGGLTASDTFKLEVQLCTDTKDYLNGMNKVTMYPNPAKDKVTLEIIGKNVSNTELLVSDILGNRVLKKTFKNTNNVEFDLGHQASGLYFVKLNMDGKEVVKKLILD